MTNCISLKRQRGVATILELSIVAVVSLIGLTTAIWATAEGAKQAKFEAQGTLVKTLANSVNNYIVTNYTALMNGAAVPGVANPVAPTIAELRALAVGLPTTFSSNSLFGPGYAVSIFNSPTGCTPPACDVMGMVYINGAINNPSTGIVESAGLGAAIAKIGGDGAYSDSSVPGTLYGYGGQWTAANPVGAVAGVLAVRTGYGSGGFAQFTRRDGSMLPTADWNFGGYSIKNAGTIQLTTVVVDGTACSANGTLASDANSAVMSCQSGVWRAQKTRYWKDPVASFAALPATDEVGVVRQTTDTNRAYAWNGAAWKALAVDQNGNISVPGTATIDKLAGNLQVTTTAVENAACAADGMVATSSTTSGLLLSCQSGVWRKNQGAESQMVIAQSGCTWCGTASVPMCPVGWQETSLTYRSSTVANMNDNYRSCVASGRSVLYIKQSACSWCGTGTIPACPAGFLEAAITYTVSEVSNTNDYIRTCYK